MNIDRMMQRDVIAATEDESLLAAREKIKRNGIKHLPVLDKKGDLVGIVTDRDIKEASASRATSLEVHELNYLLERLTLAKIMKREPVTGTAEMSVREAARTMYEKRIGCLPITDGRSRRLLGIVTSTDMLKHIAEG